MNSHELIKKTIAFEATDEIPFFIDLCPEFKEKLKKNGIEPSLPCGDVLDISIPWWDWSRSKGDVGWQELDPPSFDFPIRGYGVAYSDFFDNLKVLRDQSDKYFLARIYGSHFEKAFFARGIENFLADLAMSPEYAKKLLQKIIDKNLVMLENILDAPEIDGILLGSDWGSQRGPLMSPETWLEFIAPGEQAEYDLIHSFGKDVWIHSCGNIKALIPHLIKMGVNVLNPVQPEAMDLQELKTEFGGKITFWGGLSTQQTLPFGTPDEVQHESQTVCDILAPGGGYIFSPAQSLQDDVPVENFQALLEFAFKKRNYKNNNSQD